LALSLRNLGGFVHLQLLKHRHVRPLGELWRRRAEALARRLRLRREVRLVESLVLQVPAAIGWLRPVVLIPSSALTGIQPDLLEAVLLHELAHIRRHDYLVNLLQTVVETLGFFHPAVWWVSRQIRLERENCCDDAAVAALGDTPRFARALLRLEEIRQQPPELALAGTGGILMKRITRLLAGPSPQGNVLVPGVALARLFAALSIPLASLLAAEPPTAAELLQKYAEAQDGLKSFILTSEVSTELRETGREGLYKTHAAFEARSDGERLSVRCLETDHVKTDHVFCWWEGKVLRQFNRMNKGDNVLIISADRLPKERFFTWFGSGMASGYIPFDTERVDVILGKARKISLRPKQERVAGTQCYVIDADTERGRYSLWIAPKFGYHVGRLEVERGTGDRIAEGDVVLQKGHIMRESLDGVRFEKHNGVWVPMETRSSGYQRSAQGGESWGRTHFQIAQITVNPDHQAMGSFQASKGLLEGAKVLLPGVTGTVRWKDGKMVRDDGTVLDLDELLKKAAASAKGPTPQQIEQQAKPVVLRAIEESQAGEYEKALATFREAERILEKTPSSPWMTACAYNRACTYSLMGKKEEAIGQLRRAVSLGFSDLKPLQGDQDLEGIRKEKGYQEIVALLERSAGQRQIDAREEMKEALKKNEALFPFTFDLTDLDGKPLSLADFRGKVILVDIWGTWCSPCLATVPHLMRFQEEYEKKGVVVVGLAWEMQGGTQLRSFVENNKLNYRCAMIEEQFTKQIPEFGIYPTFLLIDRSGKVRFRHSGPCDYNQLAGWAEEFLAHEKRGK
jgi:thiol-disulfide isomerase/thioredoxin